MAEIDLKKNVSELVGGGISVLVGEEPGTDLEEYRHEVPEAVNIWSITGLLLMAVP